MAVDRVAKLLIAVHKDSSDSFLESLQRQGSFHIVKTEEIESTDRVADLDRDLGRFEEAIEFLGTRVQKKGGLLGESKVTMTRPDYDTIVADGDPDGNRERVRDRARELDELANRDRAVRIEVRKLEPWRQLEHAPRVLHEMDSVAVVTGLFADPAELESARERFKDRPVGIERVAATEAGVAALVVSSRDVAEEVSHVLGGFRFDPADLRGVDRRPADVIAAYEKELVSIDRRRAAIDVELTGLVEGLPSLKTLADSLRNARHRVEAEAALARTDSVLLVTGWVRERHLERLTTLVERTGTAALTRVEPDEGEEPPVALVNRKLFRPFELVLDMYSMPSPKEVDPTPLLAPAFAIFFGFCLTDAGYGIALMVIAALLMRKLGANNKLLGILLIGGFFTILAGAMVGGWFGDLPDRLGFAPLLAFKNRLMLFDPLKNPMPFFYLSLAFGYLHMMYGMVIEIVDNLRVGRPGDALLGQLPWFVALNSLVMLVVLGKLLPAWVPALLMILVLGSVAAIIVLTQRAREIAVGQTLWFVTLWLALIFFAAKLGGLPAGFLHVKWVLIVAFLGMYVNAFVNLVQCQKLRPVPIVLAAVGLVVLALYLAGVVPWILVMIVGVAFFLTAPANRAVAGKLAWGGYALYGATSYIGVVLSYIRIMALGMVTGGIGMAVNTVAWMVAGIPVLGILLAIIVLVLGHTYNLAVNVLGAFVHTLRLTYVEFFPRFFSGGGEPFVPFKEENRFIAVR